MAAMAENVELRWMPTQSQASLREKYDNNNNVEWVALSLHSSSIVQHLTNLSQRVERGPVNQDDNAVGADFGDAASVNASHYYLSLGGAVDPDCYSRPVQNQIVYPSDTQLHSLDTISQADFTDSTQSARSFAPNSFVPSTANPSLLRFTPTQPVHASWPGLPPGFVSPGDNGINSRLPHYYLNNGGHFSSLPQEGGAQFHHQHFTHFPNAYPHPITPNHPVQAHLNTPFPIPFPRFTPRRRRWGYLAARGRTRPHHPVASPIRSFRRVGNSRPALQANHAPIPSKHRSGVDDIDGVRGKVKSLPVINQSGRCLWDNCQHREEIDSKDVREHLKEHHGVKLVASDPNAQCLWSGCTVSQQYTSPVLVKHVHEHMKVLQVELLTIFHFHNVDFHGPATAEVKSQINRRDGEIGGYVEYNTRLSVLSVEWKQGPHIRDAMCGEYAFKRWIAV
ncbi:hypothetical protein C8J57DRAFT_1649222 [Mycena rebaudengoi]|nr:hypothetical protein C8J57DRAFT_1649222 [Mycena rebaudengoi]